MKKFAILWLICCAVLAAKMLPAKAEGPVLKATITKSQYLPPDMYGHWSVTRHLIQANTPSCSKMAHDIWILEKVDDAVVISNPITGGSASIQVEKVVNDTATFHNVVVLKTNQLMIETPTITVSGDRITGRTLTNWQKLAKDGTVMQSFNCLYSLEASRIGGDRLRFRDAGEEDAPAFEIEEIQQGDE